MKSDTKPLRLEEILLEVRRMLKQSIEIIDGLKDLNSKYDEILSEIKKIAH